jgi:hypothetical protein
MVEHHEAGIPHDAILVDGKVIELLAAAFRHGDLHVQVTLVGDAAVIRVSLSHSLSFPLHSFFFTENVVTTTAIVLFNGSTV